jgi:hypothetical protein
MPERHKSSNKLLEFGALALEGARTALITGSSVGLAPLRLLLLPWKLGKRSPLEQGYSMEEQVMARSGATRELSS